MKPNKPQKNGPTPDESRDDHSSEKKSGNSMLWLLLGGGALLFCILPTCAGGIVGGFYWIKPAPNDQGAGVKADGKKLNVDPKNEKPAVIAERTRFSAEFAKAGDNRRIDRIFLSRDGKRVAIASLGLKPKTQTWGVSGEPKKLQALVGYCDAISPDGRRVIVKKAKDRFIVDADTGADITSIGAGGNVHFNDDKVVWSFRVPILGNPARLTRIDTVNGQRQDKDIDIPALKDGFGNVVHLSGKGELFCFIAKSGEIHVWDVNTEKWTRKTSLKLGPGERIGPSAFTAFSPDGKWVVTEIGAVTPYNLWVFDAATGEGTNLGKEFDHRMPVFVPGRDLLLVSKREGPGKWVRAAYDVKAKAVVGTFGTFESTASIAVSADGSTLAVGTGEGQVVIWDIKKLK